MMRLFAWSGTVAGILLAFAALVIAANKPTINPWPSLIAGFSVTAVGIVLLMMDGSTDSESRN
jgi:hypothetical protein